MATSGALRIDAQTREDLQLFASDRYPRSLFEFLNRCRTPGGERVLQRRMEAPWSEAGNILDTQAAITCIQSQTHAFAARPSGFVTQAVGNYLREALPYVTQDPGAGFVVGAFLLWFGEERHYTRIIRGVKFTCRLVNSLRATLDAIDDARGELGPLIAEARRLLASPGFRDVPGNDTQPWFVTVLRLDRTFRFDGRAALTRLLQIVYELDALVSLAEVSAAHGFVLPVVEDGPVRVLGEGVVHPFVAGAVGNPVALTQHTRLLFLTGPNMAGKTTYQRAVATALYLAHLGIGVPARQFHFVPVQQLLTSISLNDDLHAGISFFRAEALRVKALARAIADGQRVVALMDEPFKGTNVKDAFDASLAILRRLAAAENCLFIVASHLIELGEQLAACTGIDYRYFDAREHGDRLEFDYRLHPGVSGQRLGMRVLREEGIFELLDGSGPAAS